jgi:hypothetical protein
MTDSRDPLPATLLALDAKGYSRLPTLSHLEVRNGIREIVAEGFRRAHIDPVAVARQDTGDGVLAVIPAHVPKAAVVADLVRELGVALAAYNRPRNADGRLRLRLALHHGDVLIDGTGFAGEAPIVVTRLVDAPAVRAALDDDPRLDLALILSERLFQDTVVERFRGLDPADFTSVRVESDKFRATAWLRSRAEPGSGSDRDQAGRVGGPGRRAEPGPAGPADQGAESGPGATGPRPFQLVVNTINGGAHGDSLNFGFGG